MLHPGANHDAFVWNHSAASQYFKLQFMNGKRNIWLLGMFMFILIVSNSNQNYILLYTYVGDSGYKLLPYMMTPYGNPTEDWQKKYNAKHSKVRNIIERCFGVLKNRFRCIIGSRGLFYSPKKTTQIVNACCALHNICIFYKSEWSPPPVENNITNDDSFPNDDSVNEDEMFEESAFAITVRNQIARNVRQ